MKIKKTDERPQSLREMMNHFFDEAFGDPFHMLSKRMEFTEQLDIPRIDVSENKKDFKVEVSLAGYEPKDIDVEVEGDILTLKGEMSSEKEDKDTKYYRKERSTGSFMRSLTLPANAEGEKAKCKMKNGVLTVTIPKKAKDKGKGKKLKIS